MEQQTLFKTWVADDFFVTAFLISISTVFLKQHSILDVLAAIPICVATAVIVFAKTLNTHK